MTSWFFTAHRQRHLVSADRRVGRRGRGGQREGRGGVVRAGDARGVAGGLQGRCVRAAGGGALRV